MPKSWNAKYLLWQLEGKGQGGHGRNDSPPCDKAVIAKDAAWLNFHHQTIADLERDGLVTVQRDNDRITRVQVT